MWIHTVKVTLLNCSSVCKLLIILINIIIILTFLLNQTDKFLISAYNKYL